MSFVYLQQRFVAG